MILSAILLGKATTWGGEYTGGWLKLQRNTTNYHKGLERVVEGMPQWLETTEGKA